MMAAPAGVVAMFAAAELRAQSEPAVPLRPARTPGRVSVIIPTYNRADLVIETLDSIAAQTWRDVEIVVVDDGSTDDTQERLDRWQKARPAVSMIIASQANAGPAAARNLGLRHAGGDYVYFIDSDDLIEPGAIATLVSESIRTQAPYVVAHIRNTDLGGRPLPHDSEGLAVISEGDYFASRWMTHGALYRRETLARVGPFDERLRRGEDTEHVWRVIATNGGGPVIPTFIGVRRIHGFGHLSVGRSASESARDDLGTVTQFVEWAQSADVFDSAIARSASRRSLLAAIRSGYAGDWTTNRQAVALGRAMHLRRRSWSRWLWPLLGVRSPLVYAPLIGCVATLKWARNRLRFVASQVGSNPIRGHAPTAPRMDAEPTLARGAANG
jgi:hypothetical protein